MNTTNKSQKVIKPLRPKPTVAAKSARIQARPITQSQKYSSIHAGHSQLNKVLTLIAGLAFVALLVLMLYKRQMVQKTVGPSVPVSSQQVTEEQAQQ